MLVTKFCSHSFCCLLLWLRCDMVDSNVSSSVGHSQILSTVFVGAILTAPLDEDLGFQSWSSEEGLRRQDSGRLGLRQQQISTMLSSSSCQEGDCVLFFYCQMYRWSAFESVVKGQRYNKAKNSLGNCAKTGSQNGWLTTWCTSVVVKLGSTDSWDQHSFPLHIHQSSWYACLKNSLTTLLCLQPFSGRNSPLTSVSPKRRSGPEFIPFPFLKMSLTSLPLLPLEKIVSYLDFSSLVSLAASTSSLAHLQPKKQLVKGEDFSMACRSYRKGKKGNLTPEQARIKCWNAGTTFRAEQGPCEPSKGFVSKSGERAWESQREHIRLNMTLLGWIWLCFVAKH